MKRLLSYLPYSISGIFLAILGILNFILSNLILLSFTKELSIILLGTPYKHEHGTLYLSEYNTGFACGLLIYLLEFFVFIWLYTKEYKKSKNNQNTNNTKSFKRLFFIYFGAILFLTEFFFAIAIQVCYCLRGL